MHSEKKSKKSTKAISWKYLGLGIAIIVVLMVVIQHTSIYEPLVREEKIVLSLETNYGKNTKKESLEVKNGSTAFQALNKTHIVEYKEYSFGYFITGIDEVRQNETHSWLYFVNGVPPLASVDNYVLEEEDILIFRFLSSEESMKYFE